jgi:hypothetical protein
MLGIVGHYFVALNEFWSQQGRQFVPNNMGQTAGMMNQNTTTG